MKKAYIYVTAFIIIFLLLQYTFSSIKNFSPKYDIIKYKKQNGLVQSIASYIFLPIIESRIDFYLKNNGIITHLESYKYDNKLLEIKDITKGKGSEVLCGQKIVVELEEEGLKKEKTIKIGTDEIQALNIGILGMKEGGVRKISVPKDLSERLTQEKDTEVSYTITLKKTITNYPESTKNLLIFEKIIGNERAIMCGNYVNLEYTLRNIKGEITKSDKLSFKVGEGKVPLAFELGIIGMVPGSIRTIISPSNLLSKNFPQDHVSIIDLSISANTSYIALDKA
ncbi:MAG: FKBP-type peptidyl-prolyl cis-trans isomerase [Rickettsiaceae bacterium H1]|nr:FKBP-type peptidyl-prolyl cis-trans isomerase [Rickettsiaceae bacterium H1]